jgi:ferredoxin
MEDIFWGLPLVLFAGHLGFSGKGLVRVGGLQYFLHKLYAMSEPLILRVVDFILSKRIMTETFLGKKLLRGIALVSRYLPHGIVITTEAAQRVVDLIEATEGPRGGRLAVGPCVCQAALNRWQEPVCKDMVLVYGADIYTHLNMGYRTITAKEAGQMLRRFHKDGLVHELDFCMQSGKWTFVICNCEKQICVLTRVYLLTGEFLYPGPEIVRYNPDACVGPAQCGRCLERCLFGANLLKDGKIFVDYGKCMGCGLCVSSCAGGARSMVPRAAYAHEHQISSKLLLGN